MKLPNINCRITAEKISDFLKKEFKQRNKNKAILAISGGVDSAVTAFLCKKTGLDFYALILPYKEKGNDGRKLAKDLGLSQDHIIIIDIASLVDVTLQRLEKTIKLDSVDKGNIMARQRMIIQYALARCLDALVVGTENLSEYYLGYFTLHGDQACDVSPISNLWKTQVYELGKYLEVPEWVLRKEPSADLWEGQTDEKEMGFTYKNADQILYLFIILKYPREKIISEHDFDSKLVNEVLKRLEDTRYKREGVVKI